MRALTLSILFALLTGCGASYNNLRFMSRTEVSEAIRYCQELSQRAVVTTAPVWFGASYVDTPVGVFCYPR